MSELDKWERDSKAATGLLGTVVLAAIGLLGKAAAKKMDEISYQSAKKAGSESNLSREENRSWIGKKLHKRDLEDARKEYDRYH